MALIGTLVSFSAGTKILSADVNTNFTAIRNAFNNTAVLTDTAATITVTHIFTVNQQMSRITVTATNGITFSQAVGRIVPGATSLSLRNNADSADNLILTDAGAATIRAGATITAGGLQITAGNLALGTTVQTQNALRIAGSLVTGSIVQWGISCDITGQSDGTTSIGAATFRAQSAASAYTVATVYGLSIADAVKGAGSTISTAYGLHVAAQSQGAVNQCIHVDQGTAATTGFQIQQSAATIGDAIVVAGGSLTGSTAKSLLNLTQTWNTSGSPTALLIDVTNTASGAASMLIDAKVGSVSRFSVSKDGSLTSSGLLTAGGGAVLASSITVTLGAGSVFFNGTGNAGTQLIDIQQGINNTLITVGGAASLGGVINIRSTAATCAYQVNSLPVVGTRKTGWTIPTGTLTRTGFTTTGATVGNVAEALAALIVDLHSTSVTATSVTGHGLIGT